MSTSPIKFYRKLNTAQEKRIVDDHQATVVIDEQGKLQYLSEQIITPKGLVKNNKKISIVPSVDERIISVDECSALFSELSHMNIILTNACNLSCTYCYEQHNKDFGRFTEESLLEAYNFLLKYSKTSYRQFQFFGGEPLIHKDLILNFLDKNKDYLSENARATKRQVISMITNGILLTPEFIQEYFGYDFTWMLISLDTLDANVDHRELEQKQIDDILASIKLIPYEAKQRVWMRCTISRETVAGLEQYINTVYDLGVRNIIIHPLTLDSTVGFIPWHDSEWKVLHSTLMSAIYKYHDLEISFSEGVGTKGENNCMIGSDMVAIDGSGDFSGCYFFTNQKGNGTDHTILGNVFNNTIYIDRYTTFQKEFQKMFEVEEQCRTCDYQNHCYQCPAGNLDTGSKMFRPDDMCQKIVKLYLDLQRDVIRKRFAVKFEHTLNMVHEQGLDQVFRTTGFYLMYLMFGGVQRSDGDDFSSPDIPADELFALWKDTIESDDRPDVSTFQSFIKSLDYNCSRRLSVKELYEFLLKYAGLPNDVSKRFTEDNVEASVGYFVLLQMLVMNIKHQRPHELIAQQIADQI